MRKFSAAVLLAVLLSLLCAPACPGASAEIVPYIQDDADLLTDAEEAALYEDMLPVCEYGTPMFWSTREPGDCEALAERFFHSRLQKGESGTLFVINMAARQLTVFSDGAIYRVVTVGEAATVTDNVYRLAGREEYYACASSAFSQIVRLLRGERIARPMKIVSNLLLALVASLLAVYLYISRRYENRAVIGKKSALPVSAAAAAAFTASTANSYARMTSQRRTEISDSSSSGSGGGFGGGGGGGGGGGSSGGGASHGF